MNPDNKIKKEQSANKISLLLRITSVCINLNYFFVAVLFNTVFM